MAEQPVTYPQTATAGPDSDAAAERWLQMFFRFFASPSPENYRPLFHPEGSLQDAGMTTPLPAEQTGAAIAMVLAKLPDLLIQPLRHAIRPKPEGAHVFVEARNSGTLNGTALDWGALYRVHLRDGLVHRGRRFYDQVDLFRPLLPADARLPAYPGGPAASVAERQPPADMAGLVDALAAAWEGDGLDGLAGLYAPEGRHLAPGLDEPLPRTALPGYGRWLDGLLSPGPLRLADWAAGERLLFVEWQCEGRFAGASVPLDRIDRYLLDGTGRIVESRSYFDTLALVERARPDVAAIRAAVIKG